EKAYKIADVVDILRGYDFSHKRRVSFEYIMFDGVNDTPRHIKGLINLLKGMKCRINLIRFHKIPDSDLAPSSDERIIQFRDALTSSGIITTIRASRGEDIFAACGMLKGK
ncbi:MAG: 23S rRNA (adenine(2503)-C(2))-methyltransferase RlmN, partial [Rikenellaceae bacterium]